LKILQSKPQAPPIDIYSAEAMDIFLKAADRSDARATKSRKAALTELVKIGIYNKNGKLTKNYR